MFFFFSIILFFPYGPSHMDQTFFLYSYDFPFIWMVIINNLLLVIKFEAMSSCLTTIKSTILLVGSHYWQKMNTFHKNIYNS
jgi:hypothetical protein